MISSPYLVPLTMVEILYSADTAHDAELLKHKNSWSGTVMVEDVNS